MILDARARWPERVVPHAAGANVNGRRRPLPVPLARCSLPRGRTGRGQRRPRGPRRPRLRATAGPSGVPLGFHHHPLAVEGAGTSGRASFVRARRPWPCGPVRVRRGRFGPSTSVVSARSA
ncbi:hypothetical protein CP969_04245 [Streptomyces viridosporus T7A]|uniref:Uncharacterized protein n=1 Tax=Streptomyces viridosporus T7A TaxID=665577 RepID=A0ABX6A9K7_STRVD|nr:hypothetical protein CP969_04245 [Streptomyces viridosporus T7A]